MRILVTGGAGFIGSNFIRHILSNHPDYHVTNLDKLTYCGNLQNLKDVEGRTNYAFVCGDIADSGVVEKAMADVDCVINFASETHVDRSIMRATEFITTDVNGTYMLLEAAKVHNIRRFLQISTDEVYGSISGAAAKEEDRFNPSNPYSASKAGAELIARSYFITHDLPVIVLRPSNNFGPYQYPEKFIPLFVTNALMDMSLPLYGDGKNVRDWLYVEDACAAIDLVLHKGEPGEAYNISGENKRPNIDVARMILKELGKPEELITFVKDRPGHDRRYSIDGSKVERLGFDIKNKFEDALKKTVEWYRENTAWWQDIKSGEFKNYYKKQYGDRHG
ncbi:MAG: dTDP-glucose 4,6-dehydratase [Planctomycetota bacterium]|jgi:dTDP-glucose 4,6-dehydratase